MHKNMTYIGVFSPNHFCPLISDDELLSPAAASRLKASIVALKIQHTALLDHFTNLNRDYEGRFFDECQGFLDPRTGCFKEAFVDMEPLEEAPIEWWRDNFGSIAALKPVERLRREARPRWLALGSIYFAWHPWERMTWNLEAANDNRAPVYT